MSVSGNSARTWASSATEVRALQKADADDPRNRARWESNSFFIVDLNLTDSPDAPCCTLRIGWDGNNRVQRVDLLDWAVNSVRSMAEQCYSAVAASIPPWVIDGRARINTLI